MNTLYNRKRARRSLFQAAFFRVVAQFATFLGFIILVREISEAEFGILNLMYAMIPIISALASFGLEQTLRRFEPEYLRGGNAPAAARLVRLVAMGRLFASIFVITVALLAWNTYAHHFGLEPYRWQFALFSLILVLHFQSAILQVSLASHMMHGFSVGAMAVLGFVKLFAYGGFAIFGGLTLEKAIVADLFAYAVAWASVKIAHRRYCSPPQPAQHFRFDPAERRRLVRFGMLNSLNDAGVTGMNVRIDNFFIAAMMNPVAVGAYSFYTRFMLMAQRVLPVRMFETVVRPMLFSIPANEADQRMPRYFTALLNTSLVLYLPMAAFGIAYHHEIVLVLFDGKFIQYSWVLPVIFVFAFSRVLANPVTLVAQHAERSGILLASKIFAVYNVGALLALVPSLGVYGAALATGSADLFKNLFVWWHMRGRARWLNGATVLGLSALVWGSVVGIAYALKETVHAPPLVHLAFGVALTGVGALIFIRSPALSTTDRQVLASVLHGKEARALRWLGVLPARG